MVLLNLLDGGLSHNGCLLGSFESMRGGTPGTNPRQQHRSSWQVSRCWMIWTILVCDEFAEYSILGTKYSSMKLLQCFFTELIELEHRIVHLFGIAPNSRIKSF
jgi:hypothetical protein